MALRLRLRGPDGKQHTCSLAEGAEFGDLVAEAASAFSMTAADVELLLGFPPALCAAAPNTALASLLRSGESVTVRWAAGTAPSAAAPPPAAAPCQPAAAAAASQPATAPRPQQGGVASVRKWSCPACTLDNEASARECAACGGPAPAGAGGSSPAASQMPGAGAGAARLVKMADDNSCLFHSMVYLLDPSSSPERLRRRIAEEVRSNTRWDEATLGKPREEYISYISSPIRWGSQVEIAIFSEAYQAEIAVVEVQSGRCDIFGEDMGYDRRVYLLHSGIHFDAIAFGSQREVATGAAATEAHQQALALGASQRAAGNYVDQQTMRLRCKICGYIANGDYEARAHAGGMGHKEFAPA